MLATTIKKFSGLGLRSLGIAVLGVLIVACADGDNNNNKNRLKGCADDNSCVSNPSLMIGGARASSVQIPSDYNTNTRYPLVILLHGFGANGIIQSVYMGLDQTVDTKQYVLVTPDGTLNSEDRRFWNATPACCAFSEEEKTIDDVAYIRGLIEEAADTYSVDTSRIGVIGHSNGGFMALRLACEASDVVTSVVSLAGSTFEEEESCGPATERVSVLLMHGTDDGTISYDGGVAGASYPGATETARRFAVLAGCNTGNPQMSANIDVDASIEGAETEVLEYSECLRNTDVTLWTMIGSPHIPAPWVPEAIDSVVDWLTLRSR